MTAHAVLAKAASHVLVVLSITNAAVPVASAGQRAITADLAGESMTVFIDFVAITSEYSLSISLKRVKQWTKVRFTGRTADSWMAFWGSMERRQKG